MLIGTKGIEADTKGELKLYRVRSFETPEISNYLNFQMREFTKPRSRKLQFANAQIHKYLNLQTLKSDLPNAQESLEMPKNLQTSKFPNSPRNLLRTYLTQVNPKEKDSTQPKSEKRARNTIKKRMESESKTREWKERTGRNNRDGAAITETLTGVPRADEAGCPDRREERSGPI